MPLFSKKSASNGQPSAVSGNGERPPEAAALARSGDSAAPVVADQPRDWSRVSELLGDLSPKTEQLQSFPDLPGSDVEPWETLLQMLAVDEHTGLARLAKRTGLAYIEEPRLQDSASRFYETVPASMAREHMVAGVAGDGESVTVATAHPMQ
ncbi:MAG: hypothetical protein IOD15_10580, partial [Phycisphaerales bacterium]|nr:hypothetical protein [Phycisphaerales bacterium]